MNHIDNFLPALQTAKLNPYRVQTIIVNGFRFHIHWDKNRGWFEGTMSYSPKWGQLTYIYGHTNEEFIKNAADEIQDSMKIYKNGGHYHS